MVPRREEVVIVQREGFSLVTFTPEGDFEYEWLMLNTDAEGWQWQGRALCVDKRLAGALLEGVMGAGFVVDFEGMIGHKRRSKARKAARRRGRL
jgi:hypothetical protein